MADYATCSKCSVNRRVFLAGAAASLGACGVLPRWALAAAPPATPTKTRIRLVFSHHREDAQGRQSEQGWPFLGYDLEKTRK